MYFLLTYSLNIQLNYQFDSAFDFSQFLTYSVKVYETNGAVY